VRADFGQPDFEIRRAERDRFANMAATR